ncbi:hypothetical protein C8R47DRAFT_1211929 [Mycena vitilis]|nr:hypothetical protein C8R47DRAFT_1211912 [Mycena vitilis]KAJ6499636.1 hypothetical protein C8R47DRAFT_1211929 [Mycena vitilis]
MSISQLSLVALILLLKPHRVVKHLPVNICMNHPAVRGAPRNGRSEASFFSQSVPNGRAQAIRSPARPRTKRVAHVVFFGRRPGVYREWFGPTGAEKEVTKAKGAVHQGYSSVGEADAAYEYADEHGWTGVRTSRPSSPSSPPVPLPDLPIPQRFDAETHNPLHGATPSNPLWHVVYAGITPGIYASYLECALNTVGLSGASYESAATREEALISWAIAESAGRIRVLTPKYSV